MNRIIIHFVNLIFFLLVFRICQAQSVPEKHTYSEPLKEDKVIVTLSSDNWSGLPDSIKSKPVRSRGFSFLLMAEKMNKSGNIGIGAGLGFMSQNVHTNGYIDTVGTKTVLNIIPSNLNYKLNKLSLNFITAAIELRLRTNENKSGDRFKLSTGIIGAFLLQSHIKYEDKFGKRKMYGIEHLRKFQYGITGRIGFRRIGLSGYYSLINVFQKNEGPELTPYSIGISFTF